jgi:hypothetical protein
MSKYPGVEAELRASNQTTLVDSDANILHDVSADFPQSPQTNVGTVTNKRPASLDIPQFIH